MKTMNLLAGAALAIVLAGPAAAGVAGTWRCSTHGPLPMGILKISGSSYSYQAVSNTAWAPKPGDRSNGSGAISASGSSVAPTSGPLRTVMGLTSGYYGMTGPASDRYEYLDFYTRPNDTYLIRCYRP